MELSDDFELKKREYKQRYMHWHYNGRKDKQEEKELDILLKEIMCQVKHELEDLRTWNAKCVEKIYICVFTEKITKHGEVQRSIIFARTVIKCII